MAYLHNNCVGRLAPAAEEVGEEDDETSEPSEVGASAAPFHPAAAAETSSSGKGEDVGVSPPKVGEAEDDILERRTWTGEREEAGKDWGGLNSARKITLST